ncbi:hypothetical protein D3C78_1356930 [compost metagenome]
MPADAQERRTALAHGGHEVVDGEGQAAIELQGLRHVADGARLARPFQAQKALMGHLPEQGLDQRAFAAAVGADQRMHVAGLYLEAHLVEDRRAPECQADIVEVQGRTGTLCGQDLPGRHAPAS